GRGRRGSGRGLIGGVVGMRGREDDGSGGGRAASQLWSVVLDPHAIKRGAAHSRTSAPRRPASFRVASTRLSSPAFCAKIGAPPMDELAASVARHVTDVNGPVHFVDFGGGGPAPLPLPRPARSPLHRP